VSVTRHLLPVLPPQPEALRDGACTTHPEPGIWASNRPSERAAAIAICRSCVARPACLAWALTLPPGDNHLIWAGLSPRQRARLAAGQRALDGVLAPRSAA
jgi:transcription factor WhiB